MSVSPPSRSIILSNMKKKLYKLRQDEASIASVQVCVSVIHCCVPTCAHSRAPGDVPPVHPW